jgi:hypothetical protein
MNPVRVNEDRKSPMNFWWMALVLLLVGAGLHYLVVFNGHHGNAASTYIVTTIYLVFLVCVPIISGNSKGLPLPRVVLGVVWLAYVALVSRGVYLFIQGK